jgi:hypothetical protein
MTTTIDRIARDASTLTRRSSLLALSAAALTAVESRPNGASAVKRKKKALARCKKQVDPCRQGVVERCAAAAFPQQCNALLLPCCDFLGTCQGREAALCFVVLN